MRFYTIFAIEILKSLSFSRVWNFIRLYYSYAYSIIFKKTKHKGLPAFISIEPTNICNLQCPECPTGNKSSIVGKGQMDISICEKLLPQIQRHTIFANLYFQGEPFINKQTISIIQKVHNAKILTSISTNAHFITKENADEIVKSGLTKLIISLDGYSQETYEKYRRNGSFQKVLDGMQAIQEAKQKNKSNLPLVELQCLLFKHTENHKKEIKEIGKKFGADIIQFKTAQFYDETNLDMLPSKKNSRYTVNDGKIFIKKEQKNRCWKMWCSCIVAWNGNVLPCCFDKNHTFTFGNILNQSLYSIWYSNQYIRFREKVHSNRKSIKMCQNCTT
ncbi:MAG: SPASM domain-containing protein [Bacteroidales bacterium]|nr:SPASM domain-containing protein [Bacteroidales bacterium]